MGTRCGRKEGREGGTVSERFHNRAAELRHQENAPIMASNGGKRDMTLPLKMNTVVEN